MKKIAFLVVVFCFMSCSESDPNLENSILIGNFKEISPVGDRLTAEFTSQSLTYLKNGINPSNSFSIRLLSANKLELSCNECDETAPRVVTYRILNTNTFEIGGFIQEAESQIITFERISL